MGNFSRNTFDPTKNYVAVRLQQGVPLVDADWNELNDVARNELYKGLDTVFSDGLWPGATFTAGGSPPYPQLFVLGLGDNDIRLTSGSALIGGRPLHVRGDQPFFGFPGVFLRYSTQPWTDPARAAQDGVDVIPPLTTPAADRTDIVYLDVWEREVDSAEDGDLINPAIGIETSVRLKREVAFRVAEGTDTLPSAPDGHFFMPLALLNRPAGQAAIGSDQIEDIRPFLYGTQGTREASFFPAFLPIYSGVYPWHIHFSLAVYKLFAEKASADALGFLPLGLPEGARMTQLKVRGHTRGAVDFVLVRIHHQYGAWADLPDLVDMLVDVRIQPVGGETERIFDSAFVIADTERQNIVDNTRYYYGLYAIALGTFSASIHGISIRYRY